MTALSLQAVRTEREIAADAVIALIVARLLPATTETMKKAGTAVGVTEHELRDAMTRYETRRTSKPVSRPVMAGGVPTGPPRRTERTTLASVPIGTRRCVDCHSDRVVEEFGEYGDMKSCDGCRAKAVERRAEARVKFQKDEVERRAASRRLSVGARNVTPRALPNGAGIALICRLCNEPIESHDETVMMHRSCAGKVEV